MMRMIGAQGSLTDRLDCVLLDPGDTLFDQMQYLDGAFRAAAAECGPATAEWLAAEMATIMRELGSAATRKPSTVPYLAALGALGAHAGRAVYVEDNPGKDFVGARSLGMTTVRVLTGEYRHVVAAPGHDADFVTANVVDLLDHLR